MPLTPALKSLSQGNYQCEASLDYIARLCGRKEGRKERRKKRKRKAKTEEGRKGGRKKGKKEEGRLGK